MATTTTISMSPILTTTNVSATLTTKSQNVSLIQWDTYEYCLASSSTSTCKLAEFIRVVAYIFLSVSLIPQIIHTLNHRSKYIAGISYMWIVIRILALISITTAHAFRWMSIFELAALLSTVILFIQVFMFTDNMHRRHKIILLSVSIFIWIIGGGIVLLLRKSTKFLMIIGYLLLSIHVLPQILLNSLLRTSKALSKFTILFLAMSHTLLFTYFYTINSNDIYLILSYYVFTFFLFVYLQSIVYADAHIHIISRSEHTVLTPGVDIFTGLDANSARSSGQEPQMFSIDDLETGDGTDIVYQPVTSNKSSETNIPPTPMKQFVWYATLASIAAIQIILTLMLVMRAWWVWVILILISILAIFGLFYLLRTKLSILQTELLRKIL